MDTKDWDERYAATELVWGAAPNALVAELLAPLPPGRAHDLACGEGRHALWLAARGWDATGIEQSGVAVARARDLAAEQGGESGGRATFVQGDLLDWAPEPAATDLVLLAFLHLPADERRRVLAAAWGALAPGGHLLVVGHDARNHRDGAGGPSDPALLYTAADLLADLGAADLTVLRAGEHERTAASGDTAIDAVLFAEKSA